MSRWRQAVRCTDVIVAVVTIVVAAVAIILAALAIILAALAIVVLPRPCSSSYVTKYHAQRAGTPAEASSSCDCPRSRYPQHLILSAYLEESGTSKARDVSRCRATRSAVPSYTLARAEKTVYEMHEMHEMRGQVNSGMV